MSGDGGRLPTVTAMASTNFDAPVIDLTANDSYGGQHPWAQYAWLRANDPVHWHEETDGPGFWAITRYADIRMISRQPKLFSSSARGVMLAESDEMGLMIQRQMMLVMDPPEHDRSSCSSVAGSPRNAPNCCATGSANSPARSSTT